MFRFMLCVVASLLLLLATYAEARRAPSQTQGTFASLNGRYLLEASMPERVGNPFVRLTHVPVRGEREVRWQRELEHHFHRALITNDGQYVVTLSNERFPGVLHVLGPDGEKIRGYGLTDLFTAAEQEVIQSTQLMRPAPLPQWTGSMTSRRFAGRNRQLVMDFPWGRQLVLTLADGTLERRWRTDAPTFTDAGHRLSVQFPQSDADARPSEGASDPRRPRLPGVELELVLHRFAEQDLAGPLDPVWRTTSLVHPEAAAITADGARVALLSGWHDTAITLLDAGGDVEVRLTLDDVPFTDDQRALLPEKPDAQFVQRPYSPWFQEVSAQLTQDALTLTMLDGTTVEIPLNDDPNE